MAQQRMCLYIAGRGASRTTQDRQELRAWLRRDSRYAACTTEAEWHACALPHMPRPWARISPSRPLGGNVNAPPTPHASDPR